MPTPTISTTVFVTTQFAGIHRWPDAPNEVQYLSLPHRHMFGVAVEVSVRHNDREIEYHQLKHYVERYIEDFVKPGLRADSSRSCEAIAVDILEQLAVTYGERLLYRVTVSEDNENGSAVEMVNHSAAAYLGDSE